MAGVPRMRTIKRCADYFKEQDPEGCVGPWNIRQLVKQGKIPFRNSGNKILIDLDMLIDYYAGIDPEPANTGDTDMQRIK